MSKLIKPAGYKALLDMKQTEQGIKLIKEFFQQNISTELRLRRVTAPLFVLQGLGINDDLNGVERAVTFPIKDLGDQKAEVVHSLAKWKRLSLAEYEIEPDYGIYTDMNAIRADEELDNLHSLYVDQWDWEAVVTKEERTLAYLKQVVNRIYSALLRTEYLTCETYSQIKPFLPREIHFIHSEELLQMYPNLSPKEREDEICKKYGAVFIIGIGGKLSNGEKHDGRAWVSVLTRRAFSASSNSKERQSARNFTSTSHCSKASSLSLSEEVSVRADSAWYCSTRLTSVRFRQVSGQRICERNVKRQECHSSNRNNKSSQNRELLLLVSSLWLFPINLS